MSWGKNKSYILWFGRKERKTTHQGWINWKELTLKVLIMDGGMRTIPHERVHIEISWKLPNMKNTWKMEQQPN